MFILAFPTHPVWLFKDLHRDLLDNHVDRFPVCPRSDHTNAGDNLDGRRLLASVEAF